MRRPRDDLDLQGPDRGRRAGVRARGLHDRRPRLRQGAQAQPRPQDPHVPADVGLGHGPQGRRRGRPVGPGASPPTVVFEFFQQSNETDWDFVWRLALMHDYEVVVERHQAALPPGQQGARRAGGRLRWQDNMISFRPRMSGVQQVDTVKVRGWDPKAKKAVTGTASQPRRRRRSRACTRSKVASDLGGGTTIGHRPRRRRPPARRTRSPRARSPARRTRSTRPTASRSATPQIKAGAKVKVEGVGTKFGGDVHRSRRRRTATAARPATRRASRSPAARRARCSS